jgi:hypothetical protein
MAKLQRGYPADCGAAAGEVKHEPRLGDPLHPCTGHRHDLLGEGEPAVALS